jgi:hypothetical protein
MKYLTFFKSKIMPIYKNLNPKFILPQEALIEAAGDHFYKIGLSQYKIGETQRNSMHNPKLIAIVISLLLIRCVISLITPEEYEEVFYWMGDFTYFLKIRIHCNVGLIFFFSSILIFLFLHYLKYRKKTSPTYLKPFAMMAGLVPPKAIGLTNPEKIKKMMKNSKIYFYLCNYCMKNTVRSIQEYLGYSPVRHSLRHAIRSGLLLLLRYLFMAIGLLSHSLLLY